MGIRAYMHKPTTKVSARRGSIARGGPSRAGGMSQAFSLRLHFSATKPRALPLGWYELRLWP